MANPPPSSDEEWTFTEEECHLSNPNISTDNASSSISTKPTPSPTSTSTSNYTSIKDTPSKTPSSTSTQTTPSPPKPLDRRSRISPPPTSEDPLIGSFFLTLLTVVFILLSIPPGPSVPSTMTTTTTSTVMVPTTLYSHYTVTATVTATVTTTATAAPTRDPFIKDLFDEYERLHHSGKCTTTAPSPTPAPTHPFLRASREKKDRDAQKQMKDRDTAQRETLWVLEEVRRMIKRGEGDVD
jgi:hypothetical protein